MKRKLKLPVIILTVFLTLVAVASAVIALNAVTPDDADGNYESKIVNRVNFTLRNTENFFYLSKTDTDSCVYSCSLSAEKTQADFYALIESIEVTGLKYDKLTISPGTNTESITDYKNAVLPVKDDGTPSVVSWDIDIEFTPSDFTEYKGEIVITFISGVNRLSSDTHVLAIPFSAIVSRK